MSKRVVTIALALFIALLVNVNDKPVVNQDEYLQLITRGMVHTDVCGVDAQLFWGDFSPADRDVLKAMLGV